jgi:hypothetical protein
VSNIRTGRRAANYAEWYQQIVSAGDLPSFDVRGCMVIVGPRAVGERAARPRRDVQGDRARQRVLPLFIPLSPSEAEHVEGFAVRRGHAPPAR